ncbi:MAG: inositol monophosphatase [Planctomycetes bacterium]|nr:inositol monophosphatase [Planctomycetota bacterium]
MSYQIDHQLLETCEAAARAGGRELMAWRGRFGAREKGVTDFVTDADLASQAAVRRVIAARFPDHGFIGEEQEHSARSGQAHFASRTAQNEPIPGRADQLCWIVDPLDGTTNYVHGYPHFAVSVAVARGSELLAGVVYDPVADKCFMATAGGGAWCDRARLKTSAARNVGEALVAVSLPARVERDAPDLLDFIEATQVCQGVRRSGSAALNLAYVAGGALDAFWASHIHPWDVAAGVLLVREAGGVVSARDGSEFDLWNPHFLAAAGRELHGGLLSALTAYRRG